MVFVVLGNDPSNYWPDPEHLTIILQIAHFCASFSGSFLMLSSHWCGVRAKCTQKYSSLALNWMIFLRNICKMWTFYFGNMKVFYELYIGSISNQSVLRSKSFNIEYLPMQMHTAAQLAPKRPFITVKNLLTEKAARSWKKMQLGLI